jgi:hypothetical protein
MFPEPQDSFCPCQELPHTDSGSPVPISVQALLTLCIPFWTEAFFLPRKVHPNPRPRLQARMLFPVLLLSPGNSVLLFLSADKSGSIHFIFSLFLLK